MALPPPQCPLPPPPPSPSPVRSPSPSRSPTRGLTRALPRLRLPGRYLEGVGRGRTTPRWAPNPRARLGAEAGIPLDGAPVNPAPRPPRPSQAPGTLELESCVVPPATPRRPGRFVRCTMVAQMQRAGRRSHAWPGPGRLGILSLGRC